MSPSLSMRKRPPPLFIPRSDPVKRRSQIQFTLFCVILGAEVAVSAPSASRDLQTRGGVSLGVQTLGFGIRFRIQRLGFRFGVQVWGFRLGFGIQVWGLRFGFMI